jgi:dihydroorotase
MQVRTVRLLGPDGLSAPQEVHVPAANGPDSIDGSGLILSPGWADLHTHLRDPGFPEKETLETGARSAAAGGFTQIVAMANTNPVTDRAELLKKQVERSRRAPIRIAFVGALTFDLQGERLTDARAMKAAGAVALSDDGRHAMNEETLRDGLSRAAATGLSVFVHAQDERLGHTREAEINGIAMAIAALERAPGAHLHLQHVSTREAVDMIADARRRELSITAEVTPHHLTLTEEEVQVAGPLAKVNPPLRTRADCVALRQALINGIIDVIATDHAPHEAAAKRDWQNAAMGICGLETALALVIGLGLPWSVIYRACVLGPRAIIGTTIGDDAILIDPEQQWTVDPAAFHSLGRNTPLRGRTLTGAVRMTICRGRVVHGSEVAVA